MRSLQWYKRGAAYHANKVLNDLCEEPAARMYATKEGPVTLYRLRKKE